MTVRQIYAVLLLVGLNLMIAGCGTKAASTDVNPHRSLEQFEKDLQLIAKHGTGDSALQPILLDMELLDEKFPKRPELTKLTQSLRKAKTADDRKKIATEMLEVIRSVKK